MSTYGPAQKKYYEKHKDTIYRRTKKYKQAYNRARYLKKKEEILARQKELRQLSLEKAVLTQEIKES